MGFTKRGHLLNPSQRPVRQQPQDNRSHVTYMVGQGVDKEAAEAYVELHEFLELGIGVTSLTVAS